MAKMKIGSKPSPANSGKGEVVSDDNGKYKDGRYLEPHERKNGPFDDYEVKDSLRKLSDAGKIQKNRKLMAHVKKEAKRQIAEHQKMLADHGAGKKLKGTEGDDMGADDHDGDDNDTP